MSVAAELRLVADSAAREWMNVHPAAGPRVIGYDVHRCCGGGKLCQVSVRELTRSDDRDAFALGRLEDGTEFLVDRRAAVRLPSRFGLTVRGFGPWRHLDLDLEAEQWGTLLYE